MMDPAQHQAASSPADAPEAFEAEPPRIPFPPHRPRRDGAGAPPAFQHDGAGDGEGDDERDEEEPAPRGWRRFRLPFLFVILPTLLVAGFEYGVAADQYVSEARFIVRAPQASPSATGLGQVLGLASPTAPADAHSVGEYLVSHDAVDALGRPVLTAMFRRPEADPVTRLWFAHPQPETLLDYYTGQVSIAADSETGITSLSVRAFRPEDARYLADRLLALGEQRVNSLNQRLIRDGLAAADRQVREAEAEVAHVEVELTRFRQAHGEIDPARSSGAEIQLTTTLEQQAATLRANFQAMAAKIGPGAPQYAAAARQLQQLDRQVAATRARLAGPARSLAPGLGEYEKLTAKQDFASKRYQAAATGYQGAREQLLKQQLFIVPVVRPNLPGKPLYPKRLRIVATTLCGLLVAYAIAWLILAGIREHAD